MIAGDDRDDFVQRQTTNDIRQLVDDRVLLTVLTSATARILDVWRLVRDGDAIGVITLPGAARRRRITCSGAFSSWTR